MVDDDSSASVYWNVSGIPDSLTRQIVEAVYPTEEVEDCVEVVGNDSEVLP